MNKGIKAYIGDRSFYRMVLGIVLPIIVQTAITNFVSLLDNVMVGRLGTDPMTGVAVANQLIFVFNLAIFGAVSGAGIYSAQFHGAGNIEGVRVSFRYKFYICSVITILAVLILWFKGEALVSLFLNESNDPERVKITLEYGLEYIRVILIGLAPFALVQCYASTLKEAGETRIPMFAALSAVGINLFFNYLLIFGKFGMPKLGVRGAAIATVMSRYVELGVLTIYTHRHKDRYRFADHLYSNWRISPELLKKITICTLPLLANELLWSAGQSVLTQTYSLRGLDVVASMNITVTVYELVSSAFFSMGTAASIIIGHVLGAGDIRRAHDYVRKLIAFAVIVALMTALIVFILAPLIPELYSTTSAVKTLSADLIRIICLIMPAFSFANCCYFIIRSGGKTVITFMFDSAFVWVVSIPAAMLLIRMTSLGIEEAYLIVQSMELIKCVFGYILLRKGVWIHNVVGGGDTREFA